MRATVVILALGVLSSPVHGYTVHSPITRPCHEGITAEALRRARAQTGRLPPIAPTQDEVALIADSPESLDDDMRDLGGATLVLGITDNDLKGYSPTDANELVPITSDPALQQEHCLRRADEDEPDGSAAALADCRGFIHERVTQALAALGADGMPDPTQRTELDVDLTIRGSRTRASLPTYYVRMAQALHALEDGFAHTYRTADQTAPTVVLNWVDQQNGVLDEARDGPGHSLALDTCTDDSPLLALRRQLAITAATALLAATVEPDGGDQAARADEVAATYLTLQPGCTFDNGWCGAPEAALTSSPVGCGCQLGRAPAGETGLVVALIASAIALASRRRRLAALLLLTLLWLPSSAYAQAATAPAVPASTAADRAEVAAGKEPGRDTPTPSAQDIAVARRKKRLGPRWGVQVALAGAVDRPGAAASLGVRFRIDEKWILGLDGEINPFFSIANTAARPGVVNAYASVVRRYPMTWDRVNLRTTLQLGISALLFDLYGAPAGSVGPYVGLSVLGLDVDLGHAVRLIFDPALISVPIPHVSGQPFYYLQYRVCLGISFGA